jgi:1,2-dihydroxy-3-keto-5-methylthiopentene dioxygenase
MAIVKIPGQNATIRDAHNIKTRLAEIGIGYERWHASYDISSDASEDEILQAYSAEIEKLKKRGGYVAADVIGLDADTPGLDEILNRFNKEHWHDEDEVRFIVKGSAIFYISPVESDVVSIEMEPGDLICVPKGTLHWFELCEDTTVRAIRLFQDPAGWTPFYTESGADEEYRTA